MGQGQHKAAKNFKEARQIFDKLGLQPWDSRGLIRSVLSRQARLARRSGLRKVPVKTGFDRIIGEKTRQDAARGFFGRDITQRAFVDLCVDLLRDQKIPGSLADQEEELKEVYDAIDFDHSGGLDVSEIAAGLSVFLGGNESKEAHVRAVFEAIDLDQSGTLGLTELQVYMRPFVKGMTPRDLPAEAEPLREYLVVRAGWQVWKELVQVAARRVEAGVLDTCRSVEEVLANTHVENPLDWRDKHGKFEAVGGVRANDMVKWVQRGNNIINSLGKVIEKEIYMFWLSSSKRKTQWHEHKKERDAKEERLRALEAERRSRPRGPGSCAAPPPQRPSRRQPQRVPPPQARQQEEAADGGGGGGACGGGGGWLGCCWSGPESPPPAAVLAAGPREALLGPPGPDRHPQAHHWQVPPPPPAPPRGRPGQRPPGADERARVLLGRPHHGLSLSPKTQTVRSASSFPRGGLESRASD